MKVHVIATGGTISSHHDGNEWTNLDGPTLVAELGDPVAPGVRQADVEVVDVASGPSSHLSTDDMVAIAARVGEALHAGADGVVVVHGTDTMELTAFVTQLLLGTAPGRRPVVFTGSMRVHSHPAPDGPRNLRDAIGVAASTSAIGRDVMLCLEGSLHAADRVQKHHAASVDAFHSAPFAPMGTVRDGVPTFPTGSAPTRTPATGLVGSVPLVTCYPGIEPADVEARLAGVAGAVVEGFGDLNVPSALWGPIRAACQRGALVVLASRPFTPTVGGELLGLLGAHGAGGLTAQKARLAVMAALATAAEPAAAVAFLHQYALTHHPGDRGTTA